MKNWLYFILAGLFLVACGDKKELEKEWQFDKVISLDGINPIGIATDGSNIFLSDGDHNRLVKVDRDGQILTELDGFERPMHLDYGNADLQITDSLSTSILKEAALFVPEYGRDSISVIRENEREYLVFNDSLDAPAGVSIFGNEIAIADFYNNRILYNDGNDWISFGKEGNALGDFYYPTDVQITENKIFVADAYNNRGQVFDKEGNVLAQFGQDQNLNAATGIYVSDTEIFLTDFENNRVLVYDKEYQLKQILEIDIDKPTDMMVIDELLFITNYRKGELVQYSLEIVSEEPQATEDSNQE
jgi:DNA-binding beta-propeller fold protein YncE